MAAFDPYRKWLGIPEESRPPTHYQLLGISPQERDAEVIDAAVIRQSAYVRNFQAGKYADESSRLLTEIAAAKACLTNAAKRTAYDSALQKKQVAAAPKPAAKAAPTPQRSPPARPQQQPQYQPQHAPVAVAPRVDPLLEQMALGSTYAPVHPAFLPRKKQGIAPLHLAIAGGLAVAIVVVVGMIVGMLMNDNEPIVTQAEAAIDQAATPTVTGGIPIGGQNPHAGTPNNSGNTGSGANAAQPVTSNSSGSAELNNGNTSPPAADSDDDPPEDYRPRNPPRSSGGIDWGASERLSVPAPDYHVPIFSRGYSPFVAVAGEIWNLESGESIGKIDKQEERMELAALSADGRYFACPRDVNAWEDDVDIWDTQTGRRVQTLVFEEIGARPICMEFSDLEHIVVAWTDGGGAQIQLWNVNEGEGIVWFKTDRFDADDFDLSPDGKYAAVATREGLLIYDIKKKKIAARAIPPEDDNGNQYLNCDGVRFAPDGLEVAVVENRGQRILVWNGKAELVFEHESSMDFRSTSAGIWYKGPAVEWLPDGAGWLLNGHYIFERESEQVVMIVKNRSGSESRAKILGDNQLIVTRGDGPSRELISLDVPWEKIRNSVAASRDSSQTVVGRGKPVGLNLEITGLKSSTQQAASTELQRIIAARLQEAGMRIGSSDAGVLQASYSETTENRQLPVLDGMGRPIFTPGQGVTFREVLVTVGNLSLAFTVPGSEENLWAIDLQADNGGGQGVGNLFSNLAAQLNGAALPSFIPASDELIPLPVIADLE